MAGFKRSSRSRTEGRISRRKDGRTFSRASSETSKTEVGLVANDHVPSGIVGSGRLVGNLSNGISDEIDDTNDREESAWRNGRDCTMTIMVFPRTFGTNGWIRG